MSKVETKSVSEKSQKSEFHGSHSNPRNRILSIDPRVTHQKISKSSYGSTSPQYPISPNSSAYPSHETLAEDPKDSFQDSPPLGSVLRTSPDLTPAQMPNYENTLPRVPPRQSPVLMSYGRPKETASPNITATGSAPPRQNTSHSHNDEAESISRFISSLPEALGKPSSPPRPPISIPQGSSYSPQYSQQTSYPRTSSYSHNPYPPPPSYPQAPYSQHSSYPQAPYSQSSEPKPELSPEEIQQQRVLESKLKADYRVKYSILRDAYPQMNIPEPDENKSIPEIESEYKEYIKRIIIDSSVEQNKIYLLMMWLAIEAAGLKLMRIPLFKDYTKSQFKYMNKYQRLLIELGESAAAEGGGIGSGWPVEIRILALSLFNGVIFILVKLLADKIGAGGTADDLANMIGDFLTQNPGEDILRRAEQATADGPPPPQPQEATPPLGALGPLFAQMMSGFMGSGAANNSSSGQKSAPETKPEIRKPTTFASRRRKRNNTD